MNMKVCNGRANQEEGSPSKLKQPDDLPDAKGLCQDQERI
jgi:hypothetical protein